MIYYLIDWNTPTLREPLDLDYKYSKFVIRFSQYYDYLKFFARWTFIPSLWLRAGPKFQRVMFRLQKKEEIIVPDYFCKSITIFQAKELRKVKLVVITHLQHTFLPTYPPFHSHYSRLELALYRAFCDPTGRNMGFWSMRLLALVLAARCLIWDYFVTAVSRGSWFKFEAYFSNLLFGHNS